MILLNAGIPVFIFEYPAMILALLAVISIEYGWLGKYGFTLAPVLWSNIASTLVGVPLSHTTRVFIANDVIKDSADPFESTVYMGENSYQGGFLVVLLIIFVFNYIFSVLIEWGIYKLYYRAMPAGLILKRTLMANCISYLGMALAIPILLLIISIFT